MWTPGDMVRVQTSKSPAEEFLTSFEQMSLFLMYENGFGAAG